MADQFKLPRNVSPDRFLDMVRAATFDAVLEVLRSGSNEPSAAGGLHNLLAAIRDGSEQAVKALLRSGEIRPAIPRSAPEPDAPAADEEAKP